jgi:hypothetical protein
MSNPSNSEPIVSEKSIAEAEALAESLNRERMFNVNIPEIYTREYQIRAESMKEAIEILRANFRDNEHPEDGSQFHDFDRLGDIVITDMDSGEEHYTTLPELEEGNE